MTRRKQSASRIERGDWQTPPGLARRVVALLSQRGISPESILEPTCGKGSFVRAAVDAFPCAVALGFDVDAAYIELARADLGGRDVRLEVRNFFEVCWEEVVGPLPSPLLVLGNPPWVTSADLGALGSSNVPTKTSWKGLRGLDAMTGKSNFDVSEWMILRLVTALKGHDFTLAMLCKASVARRVMERLDAERISLRGSTYRIDARAHFDAAVDAVLLVLTPPLASEEIGSAPWPVYEDLEACRPSRSMGIIDGRTYSDTSLLERTRHLAGHCAPAWRSGLKHDCARVMELVEDAGVLMNGEGERVDIEPDYVFPLLKGSDVANQRVIGNRRVLVPQRALGEDTRAIRQRAPRTWEYLERHRAELDARKSSIYRGQPPFAVFGVGPYTFAPYKVAICGLYKRIEFVLVEPRGDRPVLLDDTCYFLPFESRHAAESALAALQSEAARAFFSARVFWEDKRPLGKALLDSISLEAVRAEMLSDARPAGDAPA